MGVNVGEVTAFTAGSADTTLDTGRIKGAGGRAFKPAITVESLDDRAADAAGSSALVTQVIVNAARSTKAVFPMLSSRAARHRSSSG